MVSKGSIVRGLSGFQQSYGRFVSHGHESQVSNRMFYSLRSLGMEIECSLASLGLPTRYTLSLLIHPKNDLKQIDDSFLSLHDSDSSTMATQREIWTFSTCWQSL